MLPAYPLSTIHSKSKGGQKLAVEGRNPFQLDPKEPSGNFQDFLMGEVRYASLHQTFPDEAKRLHAKLEAEYKERYEVYKRITSDDLSSMHKGLTEIYEQAKALLDEAQRDAFANYLQQLHDKAEKQFLV